MTNSTGTQENRFWTQVKIRGTGIIHRMHQTEAAARERVAPLVFIAQMLFVATMSA